MKKLLLIILLSVYANAYSFADCIYDEHKLENKTLRLDQMIAILEGNEFKAELISNSIEMNGIYKDEYPEHMDFVEHEMPKRCPPNKISNYDTIKCFKEARIEYETKMQKKSLQCESMGKKKYDDYAKKRNLKDKDESNTK